MFVATYFVASRLVRTGVQAPFRAIACEGLQRERFAPRFYCVSCRLFRCARPAVEDSGKGDENVVEKQSPRTAATSPNRKQKRTYLKFSSPFEGEQRPTRRMEGTDTRADTDTSPRCALMRKGAVSASFTAQEGDARTSVAEHHTFSFKAFCSLFLFPFESGFTSLFALEKKAIWVIACV